MKISWKEKAKYVLTDKTKISNGFFVFIMSGIVAGCCSTIPLLSFGYSHLFVFNFLFGFSAMVTMMMGLHQIFLSKDVERYIQIDKQEKEDIREKEKQAELERLEKVLHELYCNTIDSDMFDYIKQTRELLHCIQVMKKEGAFSIQEEHQWTSTVPRDLTHLFVLFGRMDEKNQNETKETMKHIITNKQQELECIYQRYQNIVRNNWETVAVITESREIE